MVSSRQDHYRGLSQGLIPYILEVADRAAMSRGIEPRYPFFDTRLAEYCLALPDDQKLHNGWTRIVMRRAMTGILPPEVQWRGGKANLGVGFLHGVEDINRLKAVVENPSAAVWQYVDRATVRQMYEQTVLRDGKGDRVSLWQAATLDAWLTPAAPAYGTVQCCPQLRKDGATCEYP